MDTSEAGDGTGPPEEGGEVEALLRAVFDEWAVGNSEGNYSLQWRAALARSITDRLTPAAAAVPGPGDASEDASLRAADVKSAPSPEEGVEGRGEDRGDGWLTDASVAACASADPAKHSLSWSAVILAREVMERRDAERAEWVEGRVLLYGQDWEVVDVENEDGTVWCSLRPLGAAAPAATEGEGEPCECGHDRGDHGTAGDCEWCGCGDYEPVGPAVAGQPGDPATWLNELADHAPWGQPGEPGPGDGR